MLEFFLDSLVALAIAVDPLGIAPLFAALTRAASSQAVRRMALLAVQYVLDGVSSTSVRAAEAVRTSLALNANPIQTCPWTQPQLRRAHAAITRS